MPKAQREKAERNGPTTATKRPRKAALGKRPTRDQIGQGARASDVEPTTAFADTFSALPPSTASPIPNPFQTPTLHFSYYNPQATGQDLNDYDIDMNDSTTSDKPIKTPRPPNAWIIYRSDHIGKYQQPVGKPPMLQAEVSKLLGKQWREESAAVRAEYERRAEVAKAEHAVRYPGYRFKPEKKEVKIQRRADEKAEKERSRAAARAARSAPYSANSFVSAAQGAPPPPPRPIIIRHYCERGPSPPLFLAHVPGPRPASPLTPSSPSSSSESSPSPETAAPQLPPSPEQTADEPADAPHTSPVPESEPEPEPKAREEPEPEPEPQPQPAREPSPEPSPVLPTPSDSNQLFPSRPPSPLGPELSLPALSQPSAAEWPPNTQESSSTLLQTEYEQWNLDLPAGDGSSQFSLAPGFTDSVPVTLDSFDPEVWASFGLNTSGIFQLQQGMGSDLQNALPPQQLDVSFGLPFQDASNGLGSEMASFIQNFGAFQDTANTQSWEQQFPDLELPQVLQGWTQNLLTDDTQSSAANGVEAMLEYVNYDDGESSHSPTHPDTNYDPVQRTEDDTQQASTSHDPGTSSSHSAPASVPAPAPASPPAPPSPAPSPPPPQPYKPPSGASNASSRRVGGTWKPPVA